MMPGFLPFAQVSANQEFIDGQQRSFFQSYKASC